MAHTCLYTRSTIQVCGVQILVHIQNPVFIWWVWIISQPFYLNMLKSQYINPKSCISLSHKSGDFSLLHESCFCYQSSMQMLLLFILCLSFLSTFYWSLFLLNVCNNNKLTTWFLLFACVIGCNGNEPFQKIPTIQLKHHPPCSHHTLM